MNIKEALLIAHGSNVFTQEFQEKYTFIKGNFKNDLGAKDFLTRYKKLGYTTKKQTVNSLGMIFCTAIKEN